MKILIPSPIIRRHKTMRSVAEALVFACAVALGCFEQAQARTGEPIELKLSEKMPNIVLAKGVLLKRVGCRDRSLFFTAVNRRSLRLTKLDRIIIYFYDRDGDPLPNNPRIYSLAPVDPNEARRGRIDFYFPCRDIKKVKFLNFVR